MRGYNHPLSIAPMMERTNRHFRFFLRQITKRTLLYTEMITTRAVLHGDRDYLLGYDDVEHPIALQLGGDDPVEMAECAKIAQDWGYDEVNINVGCPSDRVQKGSFVACLMARPDQVARCVEAMRRVVDIPVTVKHRIGIDEIDQYEDMLNFVRIVSEAGSDRFTVHARKAWLQGLSPKQNRNIPPLRYPEIYRLKEEMPHLRIEINGGIKTVEDTLEHLKHVDAVMIGRAAYENPYVFARMDREVYGDESPIPTREEVIHAMLPYIDRWVGEGMKMATVARHMLTLFQGQRGTRAWKRTLTENAHKPDADSKLLLRALEEVKKAQDSKR